MAKQRFPGPYFSINIVLDSKPTKLLAVYKHKVEAVLKV